MYYNFYIFLMVLAILSPITAYNRSEILKKISIEHEVIFISIYILILYGLIQLYNNKKLVPDLKNNTLGYLIINGTLTSIGLYLGAQILKNEAVFKYKTLQKSVYLIILVIVAVCVYQQNLTLKTIIGLLFIIFGSYLIDINV